MSIREEIDRIICRREDPEIPYEEQSAPMLDWSWSVTNQIISLLKAEIEKMENPHNGKWVFLDKSKAEVKQLEADAYSQAIQDFIAKLEEK